MKHPFKGFGLLYYMTAWAVIIIAHALVLIYGYSISARAAIIDSLFCNLLLAGLGFSLWWAIQYINPKTQGVVGTVISFAVIVLFGSYVVNVVCGSVLHTVFTSEATYLQFAKDSRPWRLVTSSLYLSIIILVYYLLKHSFSLTQKEKEEAQLQTLLKQSELEALKFQINPHFIFNSLNSISSLTLSEPDKAREMVIKLSEFLRGSLGQGKSEMHTLEEELEQMHLYLDIEKVRFEERLNLSLAALPEVMTARVPNMILQPLYENAIKYGVYEQLKTVDIRTHCYFEDSRLVVKVSNSYDSTCKPQKGKGIGLNNVRSRLELIYGFPDLVTIQREKDLFCIKLEIPQNSIT